MPDPIDVLVIGFGALGGIYSFVLERSGKARVTAIARSSYEAMSKHGINIRSAKFGDHRAWRPYRIVKDVEEAKDRNYGMIICAIKCLPDIQPMAAVFSPFLAYLDEPVKADVQRPKPPTIVLVVNGVGVEQPIAEAFPAVHIISCVGWIGANLLMQPSKDGSEIPTPVIEHGKLENLVLGIYQGEGGHNLYGNRAEGPSGEPGITNSFVEGLLNADATPMEPIPRAARLAAGHAEAEKFAEMLRGGGGSADVVADIQPARWSKNAWNAAFSSMAALSRSPTSAGIAPEVLMYTLPVMRRTMLEVLYVARALNYGEDVLPAKNIDNAIKLTISHYQVRNPLMTPATPARPDLFGGIDPPASSDSPFDDDDEDEEDGKAHRLTAGFKPSMLLDIENGRPMELEPIIGAVLDRARLKAIETPRLDTIYALLKIQQEAAAHRYAASDADQGNEQHLHTWSQRKPSVAGAGAGDSRDAWKREVRRRARLVQQSSSGGGLVLPSKAKGKVTGRPLAADVP